MTYIYAPSSKNSNPGINKSGEFDHRGGSLAQSKTISFSRTYSFTGSISSSAETGVIISKVGVSFEASLGISKTVPTSSTFNVAPRKYGYYQVGSKRMVTSGKMTPYNLTNCTTGTPYNVCILYYWCL